MDNEAELDALMRARGATVIEPERLDVEDQVRAVRGADLIVGPSGSAMHLSAFAHPGTRVLEVCDARSPAKRLPNQQVIDAACGHLTAVIQYREHEGGLDMTNVRRELDRLEA